MMKYFISKLMNLIVLALFFCYAIAQAGVDTGLAGDDSAAGPFPIGFTFKYYGKDYTNFYTSTNGLITFAGANSSYSNGALPSANNTIYVFWDDLRTDVSGQPAGKIKYQTLGEAPNRQLVVQWTNQYFFGSGLPMGTFQAVLFEGSNQIKMQYRYLRDPRSTGSSATIGIQGNSNAEYIQYAVDVENSIHAEQALTYIPDSAGLNYVFDAEAPYDFLDISGLTPDAPIVSSRYVNLGPTWSWVKLPELNAYQIDVQTDAGVSVVSENVGNVASYTLAGYEHGKTYQARVRGTVNNGGTWELPSGWSLPITIDQVMPTATLISALQSNGSTAVFRYATSDDLSGVQTISMQVATDSQFQNVLWDGLFPNTSDSYTFSSAAISVGSHLYARIKAIDQAGNESAYSNVVDVVMISPPVAGFTVSSDLGQAPFEIQFNNITSGVATSYYWNFGDGRTSTDANPQIRYGTPGTYTVNMQATGPGGAHSALPHVITITPDMTPPDLGNIQIDGISIGASLSLTQTKQLVFSVSDANGLQSVSAVLSGQALVVNNFGNGSYGVQINPLQYDNGDYSLQINAMDVVGNASVVSVAVAIDLPPPDAPVLSMALANGKTNHAELTLVGTSLLGTEAQISVNGVFSGVWVPIIAQKFDISVLLQEGVNRIAAVVRNNRGTSRLSNDVLVTLDTSKPITPVGFVATTMTQGRVRLTWSASTDVATMGVIVLRATTPFDTIEQASILNSNPLTARYFDDMPALDGVYYYRLAAVNQLGTLSLLSNLVQAVVDATAPKAVSIIYTPMGKVDAATGRIGQGQVNVVLNVSEALGFAPYLAIVPQGGQPIPVELAKISDTQYSGSFTIDAGTLSGEAQALFSARDIVGNRGTQIDAGSTLKIDTEGPALTGIALAPAAPIKNDPAQTVVMTLTASKAIKASEMPLITAQLSGTLRTPISATAVARINATTWQASIVLPADAGLSAPETLVLTWRALDDLDNVSTKITAVNRFQVYQGNLPPLDAPLNFTAKALPGGAVSLAWQAVAEAQGYQIYRQAPGETELKAYLRVTSERHRDQTMQDGRYKYAVATVRKSGEQESLSGQTQALEVAASSTAPGAPQNLALQVTGQGLLATWQAPLASEVASYNLYRGSGLTLASITGLAPIKTNIRQTMAIDASPSLTDHAYVVTALDAVGNESVISNSVYLNASLLPVSTLKVEQLGNDLPVLSWTASRTSVAGYNVYLGADAARLKMTATPTTALTYTDSGFTSGERRYTVAATDTNGIEMPRSIVMPNLAMQIASGLPIKRGLMNRLQIQVSNTSAMAVDNARVAVELGGKTHRSEAFSLAANETRLLPVVVGGYTTLSSSESVRIGVEITPNEGEFIKIARNSTVDVVEGALQVALATESFTRGATGKVRVNVENTSDIEVEVLTARNSAADSSSELRFKLLDTDGNVLATQAFKQGAGANVITLANGLTVARIAAGATYASDTFEVNVPAGSPDKIRVKLEMDKVRFHSGQDDEVLITGKNAETTVSLLDTAYYGEVANVEPVSSFGDKDVTITGQALDRATKLPLPNSKLKLILNQQGFERIYQVVTDAAGAFTYVFKPTLTDAGVYKVSAVHPDITDRPEQKSFTINRVAVGPTTYNLTVPRNYTYTVPLQGVSGVGTSAANLRLALEADAQPSGQIPAGIALTLPNPVTLTQRQTLAMPLIFTADNTAVSPGSVVLRAYADESPTTPLGQVTINYTLSEAKPNLTATPSYIETGLAMGGSEVESIVVGNNGQQEALDLQFMLLNQDGTAAPDWAKVASVANGTLAVGDKRSIDLSFTPSSAVAEGIYRFKLRVTGSNVSEQSLNVFVSITQSGKGGVMFKAADIYTATLDAQQRLIPGLAGAKVVVQNEDVTTVMQELVTDNLGEAMFQDLPVGRYKYKATASNHQETTGRFAIKPGITLNQPIFLDYNLITVDWTVKEVTLEDRYDIVINTTYETNVPAPVVVLQPASVNLPTLKPGEVFYGELTLTNYGLVRADSLKSSLPKDNAYFKYEFLVDLPTSLAAKSRLTIPYRVTTLKSLEESGAASGGGCWSQIDDFGVDYQWRCANGDERCGVTKTYWVSVSASTCTGGAGGIIGGGWTGGGGGGTGGGWTGGGGTTTELANAPVCAACKTGKCCTQGGGAAK